MDCSPPGSSVHGILQARILEWVAISFSRGSSQPTDGTRVSWIAGRLSSEPPGELTITGLLWRLQLRNNQILWERCRGQGMVAGELPRLLWVHYPSRTSKCSPVQKRAPKSHSLGGFKEAPLPGHNQWNHSLSETDSISSPSPKRSKVGMKVSNF